MSGCVQRNAIPAKVEIEQKDGSRLPPEKSNPADFAHLPDSERTALFALSQWCGGSVNSFLLAKMAKTRLSTASEEGKAMGLKNKSNR